MSLVIRAAARTLPASIRDRYREQWLADARDATEAGLSPASIALAAVTFALAAPRPLERRQRGVSHAPARARLASALALSAAVLGISQFAPATRGMSTSTGYNMVVFLGTSFLLLYLVLAPLVALVLIATRDVGWRVRVAVPLLIVASFAGIVYGMLNGIREASPVGSTLIIESSAVLAGALALVVTACVLLAGGQPPAATQTPRPLAAVASALLLVTAVAVGLANVLSLQHQLRAADIEFVATVLEGQLDGAAAMLAHSQQATTVAIAAWAGIAAVVVVAAVVLAYRRPRHTVTRTLAVLFVLMITHAGLLTFVWLNSFGGPGVHLTVSEEVLLLVGRWGLVAVVLYAVGGVKLTRVRHRHDIEGTVELRKR